MKRPVYKKCSICLSFICRYSRVFNVGSSCHAADVPSVSDFVPNPMNLVRICGRKRFCYPYRAKIVIMWGDFFVILVPEFSLNGSGRLQFVMSQTTL
jgi:hypothetical protein